MITPDGAHLAVVRHAGGDPKASEVFLSHATGFCGAAWRPVAEAAAPGSAGVTWWDFRGHGRSGRAGIPISWWEMATDVAAVRDAAPVTTAVGVGHSMGGAALVMAQLSDPGRFQALVLIEPIIVSPPYRRQDHHLASLARRRRRRFGSRAEAEANFAGKEPFSRWHPDALAGYLDTGLTERSDGSVELSCPPELEAELYTAAGGHGLAALVDRVEVPVRILAGSDTDTYPLEWPAELAERFPRGELRVVDGTGHFLPMERPEAVVEAIDEVLAVSSPSR